MLLGYSTRGLQPLEETLQHRDSVALANEAAARSSMTPARAGDTEKYRKKSHAHYRATNDVTEARTARRSYGYSDSCGVDSRKKKKICLFFSENTSVISSSRGILADGAVSHIPAFAPKSRATTTSTRLCIIQRWAGRAHTKRFPE